MVTSLILFFARLSKYIGSGYGANERAGYRGISPLHNESDTLAESALEGYDPVDSSDLSYEDALLNLEIRSFMLAEYSSAEPPRGVFGRLMRAIEQQLAPANANTHKTGGYLAAFYRAMSGPVSGRLMPGAVTLALLVMLFGANGSQMLGLGGSSLRLQQTPFSAPTPELSSNDEILVKPDGSQVVVHGLSLPIKNETQFLDRVERRLPPQRHDNKAETNNAEPEQLQYDRSNGAE